MRIPRDDEGGARLVGRGRGERRPVVARRDRKDDREASHRSTTLATAPVPLGAGAIEIHQAAPPRNAAPPAARRTSPTICIVRYFSQRERSHEVPHSSRRDVNSRDVTKTSAPPVAAAARPTVASTAGAVRDRLARALGGGS